MSRLKEFYKKEIIPKMKEIFNYKNDLAVPKIEKITLNIGVGKASNDLKIIEEAKNTLIKITGQIPIATKAKKSIAGFKVKKGKIVGFKVTLRGERMYDFLDKLINVVIPRTRDFRGLPISSLDKEGNLSIGFREQLVFPEINPQEIEKIHGLEVTITTNTRNKNESLTLLKLFGFPFKEK
ncbi:MAG: 50S ribosomal protein L5 [Patescibacteria group bacterium]